MANTKKAVTKKTAVESKSTSTTTVTSNVAEPSTTTDVEKETAKEVVKKEKNEKKVFNSNDLIQCKSSTVGELIMIGNRTGIVYEWAEMGDIQMIEYQDLIYAIRSRSQFIFKPFIIIEDDELLEQNPSVKEIYEAVYNIDDLTSIFDLPISDMKQTILALPDGIKDTVKSLASINISNGTLDSLKKIKALDEIFDTNLLLVTKMIDER